MGWAVGDRFYIVEEGQCDIFVKGVGKVSHSIHALVQPHSPHSQSQKAILSGQPTNPHVPDALPPLPVCMV